MVAEGEVGKDVQFADCERGFAALRSPAECEGRCLGLGKVGAAALRGAVEGQRDRRGDAFDAHGRGVFRSLAEEEDVHFSTGLGVREERKPSKGLCAVETDDQSGLAGRGLDAEKCLRIIINRALPAIRAAAGIGKCDRGFCIDAGHVEGGLVVHEIAEQRLHVHGLRAAHDGGRGGGAFAEDVQAVDRRRLGDVRLDEQVLREFVDPLGELLIVDAFDRHVLRDERPCLVTGSGVAITGVERDGAAGGLGGKFKVRDELRLGELEQVILLPRERGPAGGDVVVQPRRGGFGRDVALCARIEK